MQSTLARPAAAASPDDLAALFADLKAADAAIYSAVTRVAALAGSGVCERVEGGPLEWAIGMVCRLTGSDRRMIVAAGETLEHLPTVRRLWGEGLLSWGQVRAIVLAVRRLPIAGRQHVDARLAASVEQHGGIDAFDPDHLVEAADRAAEDLSDPRTAERREERAPASNFVSVQQGLDGRVKGYFDYDPVNGAIVLNGMDAASPRPEATHDHEPGQPTTRGRQYAEGLVEMARTYLGGDDGDPDLAATPPRRPRRRARPLFIVHVDLADITRGEGGILELNVRGRLSRICGATLEVLSRDADMRAVLFDGARPLAVSRKRRADTIPDDARIAVRARDMGSRWPGSRSPLGHVELHHLRHRENGGDNDPDNLAAFTRDEHLNRIHKHGWRVSLDPATGMLTIRRKHRTWRSLPRSAGLARPPDNRPPTDNRPPPDRRTSDRSPPGAVHDEPLPF